MKYTKASERDKRTWSLPEFIALYGKFSIIKDHRTGCICGVFGSKGVYTLVHLEKKIRGTSISDILGNQSAYEVIVVIDEYCLYKKGTLIDYSTVWEDSNSDGPGYKNLDLLEYFNENPDIFDGRVL